MSGTLARSVVQGESILHAVMWRKYEGPVPNISSIFGPTCR